MGAPFDDPFYEPAEAGLETEPVTEAVSGSLDSRWRRVFFRGMRLLAAGAIVLSAAYFGRHVFTAAESDQAFINAPILAVRAPIGGQLELEALEPGALVPAGTPLFRIDNPRFGNVEIMTQLNWIREQQDRLRAEVTEAELRQAKQEEVFQYHDNLYQRKLIPRLEHLEEENKVALCRAAVGVKKDQLRSAEARHREVEQHLALQKQATVAMPCEGAIWAVRAQNGGAVAPHETVLLVVDPKRLCVDAFVHEKHADKYQVGTSVNVRTVNGQETWPGRVESVRAGVGRLDPESFVAVPPTQMARRRVAVRVKLTTPLPFDAGQFFGVGRSVVVSLPGEEK